MSLFSKKDPCEKYFDPRKKTFKSKGFKTAIKLFGLENKIPIGLSLSVDGWEKESENQILTEELLALDIAQYETCKQLGMADKNTQLYKDLYIKRGELLTKIVGVFVKKNSHTT